MVFTWYYFRKIWDKRLKNNPIFATNGALIKSIFKHIISFTINAAVLLPMAIQLLHSFEDHSQVYCKHQNKSHFDSHENDCTIFHYTQQINAIIFGEEKFDFDLVEFFTQIEFKDSTFFSNYNCYKSNRAPPYYC